MSRRRALLASTQSQNGGGVDFPVYIDFTILNSYERIHYPTPQTVALFDYIMQNAVWDGYSHFEISFQPNMVYIDGNEINGMSFGADNGEWEYTHEMRWYPRTDWSRYMWIAPYFFDTDTYPKGTIYCYNDD